MFVPTFFIDEKLKRYEIAKLKNVSCEYIDHHCQANWKEKNEEDNLEELLDEENDSIFVAGILKNATNPNKDIENTFFIECEKNSVECVELKIDIENIKRSNEEKILISLSIEMNKNEMSE
jgi:hypothetical protein